MRNLLTSAIVTFSILVSNLIGKNKVNPLIYIAIFIATLLTGFCFDKVYSNEQTFNCYLTQDERDEYFEQLQYHYRESWEYSKEAESFCDMIPSKFHRAASKAAVVAVSVGIVSRDIKSSAIAAVIASLEDLISGFGEAWQNINHNMNWCAYHLEMAEFYQDLLFNDGA